MDVENGDEVRESRAENRPVLLVQRPGEPQLGDRQRGRD